MRANNEENDGEGDRISSLPESLLSNILSCLPTKDVVQTSVLSRKWEYKWTCIYNLEFNDTQYNFLREFRKDRFCCFVDRVLMHGTGSLQSFTLRCLSHCYELSRIQAWISVALRRNVQMLEIDISSPALVLPRCIYDSNSLKELRLCSPVTLRVPNDTLFSKLTKMDLNHVTLRNQDLTNRQLLLKFPFLESLTMDCCKWRKVMAVKLDAPLLTSFHMTYASNHYQKRKQQFVFEICGSNLADFKLDGKLTERYVLPRPSLVETATINLSFKSDWAYRGVRIARTLGQMNALKYLELSGEVLTALKDAAEIGSLPLFGKLIHLRVHTPSHALKGGAAVIRLIQRAPVLQRLTVDMCCLVRNDLHYDGSEGDGIPACFSSQLKMATFVYFYDCLKEEEDLGLMKFILKNAMALEQMQLVGPHYRPNPAAPDIREHLLIFPRGSSVAQIVFS